MDVVWISAYTCTLRPKTTSGIVLQESATMYLETRSLNGLELAKQARLDEYRIHVSLPSAL